MGDCHPLPSGNIQRIIYQGAFNKQELIAGETRACPGPSSVQAATLTLPSHLQSHRWGELHVIFLLVLPPSDLHHPLLVCVVLSTCTPHHTLLIPILPSQSPSSYFSPYYPLMISIHSYCIPLPPHDLHHTFLVPIILVWSLLSCPGLHNPFLVTAVTSCSPPLSLSLGHHQNIQVPTVPSLSSLLPPSPHHLLLVPIIPS